uniref:Aamy domain-containing protein n=1 Tax=Schistosoma mansoni TaxID=6183 RepID=A0A5K4FCS9_SCHMA
MSITCQNLDYSRDINEDDYSNTDRTRNDTVNGYTTNINNEHMDKIYHSNLNDYYYNNDMEPELIGFVQKYNVVMDDGAVLNKSALLKKSILDKKNQKKFQPPFGLSLKMFIILIIITSILLPLIIIGIIIGIIYAYKLNIPNLPYAIPWWRRTQIYQINIETWANDVQGTIGRLQDIIPRMDYLVNQIGATSILFTNLLNSDINGIINWETINQSIDPTEEGFNNILPQIIKKSKTILTNKQYNNQYITIMIGLSIYATSIKHEWFRLSQSNINNVYSTFYIWTNIEPSTDQQKRHYAYDSIRRAYYRHAHGNPNSPLLNLSNPDVQIKMIEVIKFWKQKLEIKGLMIMNSSNILEEMVPGIRKILNTDTDDEFIWFADEPKIDAMVNMEQKVCLQTLTLNARVPTRSDDLHSQIQLAMNNTQLRKCSPIWLVRQLSEDNKDFETIQKLAYFLPGSYLMLAGQEVDIMNGNEQLIKWSYDNYLDYTTYWPTNLNLPLNGKQRLFNWKLFISKLYYNSLLNTPIKFNNLIKINNNYNLFIIYRLYNKQPFHRIYFIVFE